MPAKPLVVLVTEPLSDSDGGAEVARLGFLSFVMNIGTMYLNDVN